MIIESKLKTGQAWRPNSNVIWWIWKDDPNKDVWKISGSCGSKTSFYSDQRTTISLLGLLNDNHAVEAVMVD